MTDTLDGKTLNSGAGSPPLQWTFTRPTADTTTVYTDAAIALVIHTTDSLQASAAPSPTTAALTLTIGSGLTRSTNAAGSQVGRISITAAQLTTLRGTNNRQQCRYYWRVTPVGAEPFTAFVNEATGGYDGVFYVVAPGYAGVDPAKVKNA